MNIYQISSPSLHFIYSLTQKERNSLCLNNNKIRSVKVTSIENDDKIKGKSCCSISENISII